MVEKMNLYVKHKDMDDMSRAHKVHSFQCKEMETKITTEK